MRFDVFHRAGAKQIVGMPLLEWLDQGDLRWPQCLQAVAGQVEGLAVTVTNARHWNRRIPEWVDYQPGNGRAPYGR